MRSSSITISLSGDLLQRIEDYQIERYGLRKRMFSIACSDLVQFGLIYLKVEQEKSAQRAVKKAKKIIEKENSDRISSEGIGYDRSMLI